MKIAIRLDDITPDMDFQKFYRMKSILDSYQVKPLIGVVPFNEDRSISFEKKHGDFDVFLQTLVKEGWTVALHGYKHLYVNKKAGLFPLNHDSEFAGLSREKQSKMMAEGLEQLRKWGIETEIFMAPSHSYDKNTVLAMKENSLTKMTDGFGKEPYLRRGISFYPISKRRSECFSSKSGFTTLVLHTNTMEESEFVDFDKLLKKCQNQLIPYSEYLKLPVKERKGIWNVCEYLLATMKHYLVKLLAFLKK